MPGSALAPPPPPPLLVVLSRPQAASSRVAAASTGRITRRDRIGNSSQIVGRIGRYGGRRLDHVDQPPADPAQQPGGATGQQVDDADEGGAVDDAGQRLVDVAGVLRDEDHEQGAEQRTGDRAEAADDPGGGEGEGKQGGERPGGDEALPVPETPPPGPPLRPGGGETPPLGPGPGRAGGARGPLAV